MPKNMSVSEQLTKLEEDKKALERRAKELKDGAALKLGRAVIDAGGLEVDPTELKAFLKLVLERGGIASDTEQLSLRTEPAQVAA